MAYDPCLPKPVTIVHKIIRAQARHHLPKGHLPLGRRVSHWYGKRHIIEGCPKFGHALYTKRRLIVVMAKLVSPPVLTALGVAAVGASAFHGVAFLQGFSDPIGPVPVGSVVTPHGPQPGGGGPGTGTSVPEPGTAAILAVAMVVVVVSSWIQGGRAFRSTPESQISAAPLPKREKKS